MGGALREARREAGLTQTQLAAKARTPRSTIQRLEAAQRQPSRETATRIASALDRQPGELWPNATVGVSRSRRHEPLARRLRIMRGLTQREVADLAGVSIAVVKHVERGGQLRAENARRLARAFGMTVAEFEAPAPDPYETTEAAMHEPADDPTTTAPPL